MSIFGLSYQLEKYNDMLQSKKTKIISLVSSGINLASFLYSSKTCSIENRYSLLDI